MFRHGTRTCSTVNACNAWHLSISNTINQQWPCPSSWRTRKIRSAWKTLVYNPRSLTSCINCFNWSSSTTISLYWNCVPARSIYAMMMYYVTLNMFITVWHRWSLFNLFSSRDRLIRHNRKKQSPSLVLSSSASSNTKKSFVTTVHPPTNPLSTRRWLFSADDWWNPLSPDVCL